MICCCSLAGTQACLTCPNNWNLTGYKYESVRPTAKKVVTEKFDEKGNLIERITEGD